MQTFEKTAFSRKADHRLQSVRRWYRRRTVRGARSQSPAALVQYDSQSQEGFSLRARVCKSSPDGPIHMLCQNPRLEYMTHKILDRAFFSGSRLPPSPKQWQPVLALEIEVTFLL